MDACARFTERYLEMVLTVPLASGCGLSRASRSGFCTFICREWDRDFSDANAPLVRIRLRAPTGTRVEETERNVLRALDVIRREAGPEQCAK